MKPLVSIVTPSYNQAEFLEQAIRSVLEQDYPVLEYAVADGLSSDGSQTLIEKYQDRLAWWVSEKDQGQGDAIRKGMARARGVYVGWLNSDDYYLPGFISRAVDILEENPDCSLVYFDVLSVDSGGKKIKELRYGNWQVEDLLQFRMIGQPGVLMRRAAYEKSGGIDPEYHCLLDHDLWVRIGLSGKFIHRADLGAAARYHAQAKNKTAGGQFGAEALRIAMNYREDHRFDAVYQSSGRSILGGAYWLGARYLSVAEDYSEAWRWYQQAWRYHPMAVLRDWKRFLFTVTQHLRKK